MNLRAKALSIQLNSAYLRLLSIDHLPHCLGVTWYKAADVETYYLLHGTLTNRL